MNNLQRYTRNLINWVLALAILMPALAIAHGGVIFPVARQIYCKMLPDFWSGSPSDAGCAALARKSRDSTQASNGMKSRI